MKFTKMHGIGNDYVYVNCFEETVEDPGALAIKVSDRHKGIGSDGLILIKPSEVADCEMDMYNADGSRGAMCGNGIRCVGKYAYDHGLVDKDLITVATGSGIKMLKLFIEDGKVTSVRVDMGEPILAADRIPVDPDTGNVKSAGIPEEAERQFIGRTVEIAGRTCGMTCVSMGNPHAIVPVEDPAELEIEKIGPDFENHPMFPNRVNTEFIKVVDRHTVRMRVWERGSGETMACGTGACAVAVASILNGWVDREPVTVKLLGGDLEIEWNVTDNHVYMTGPAEEVYGGEYHV